MSTTKLLQESIFEAGDRLCFESQSNSLNEDSLDFLIFMITGNPGLISYYKPFLSTLHELLCSSKNSASSRFLICGNSLAGFDTGEGEHETSPMLPVGLEEQIDNIERLLFTEIAKHRKDTARGPIFPKVILMGHSVGAYILLELIRQHRTRIDEGQEDFDLIGGILLFPTITYIAKSPQGMIYDAKPIFQWKQKLLQIPHFAHVVGTIVQALFYLWSTTVLSSVIKLIMRYPEHAAETTARFIKSPIGVRQALYLAKDEMQTINEDKWEKEIWEAATSSGTNSRDTANKNLFFYWGKNDKLVANNTRDELMTARDHRSSKDIGSQEKDWKPTMVIDDKGIPHAFCLKHSEIVAEKVIPWIEEIVNEHSRDTTP